MSCRMNAKRNSAKSLTSLNKPKFETYNGKYPQSHSKKALCFHPSYPIPIF